MAKTTKNYDGGDMMVMAMFGAMAFVISLFAGFITYDWSGITTYWLSNFYAGFGVWLAGVIWLVKGGMRDWKFSDAYGWTALSFLFVSWLCILVTTPATNPERYCSHQLRVVDVYDGERFNVLTGKISSDYDSKIKSESERCERDPVAYMRDTTELQSLLYDITPIFTAFLAIPLTFFILSGGAGSKTTKTKPKGIRPVKTVSAQIALPKNSWFLGIEENDNLMEIDSSRVELTVDGEPFLTVVANVVEIIKKMHLCKGDYQKWFLKLGNMYLKGSDKETVNISKEAVIKALIWAEEGIDMLYDGSEAGEKKRTAINALIHEIESKV